MSGRSAEPGTRGGGGTTPEWGLTRGEELAAAAAAEVAMTAAELTAADTGEETAGELLLTRSEREATEADDVITGLEVWNHQKGEREKSRVKLIQRILF